MKLIASDAVNVYCVGNKDSTGACRIDNSDQNIRCVISTWPFAECGTEKLGFSYYQCIAYSHIYVANQVSLNCNISASDQPGNQLEKSTSENKQSINAFQSQGDHLSQEVLDKIKTKDTIINSKILLPEQGDYLDTTVFTEAFGR